MIIGISGFSGSGKDTVADFLVKRHFCKISLADKLKAICMDVYGFSEEQLWGASELRNIPDKRYPRNNSDGRGEYLTPRLALQLLGSAWGRTCYPPTWVEYTARAAKTLLEGGYDYYRTKGLFPLQRSSDTEDIREQSLYTGVAVADCRFINEFEGLRAAGALVIRIKRKGIEEPPYDHPSETEQTQVPDEWFDAVIQNDSTLEVLEQRALELLEMG